MTKLLLSLPLIAVAFALLATACGGGDDAGSASTTVPAGSPGAGATAQATATPTPERPLATPTPLRDGDPVVSIVAGGNATIPTAAQFRAWPQTTITANGQQYTGVTLADLAAAVGATGSYVELEGIRSDGIRYAIARHAVAELGRTSLVVLTRTGQLDFVSSSLPPGQWMTAVTAISFV